MKRIEIIVDPQGEVKVETKGFSGSTCREASKLIEQALGQRTAEQLKPESWAVEATHCQSENRNM